MIKTRRILMAEKIERAVNLKMANKGDKMTTQEIDRQISMQKMHNARTKRAFKNIKENDKLYAQYGGMYTTQELNIIHDIHPGLKAAYDNRPENVDMNEIDIAEVIDQVNMFAHHVQEDNQFMV